MFKLKKKNKSLVVGIGVLIVVSLLFYGLLGYGGIFSLVAPSFFDPVGSSSAQHLSIYPGKTGSTVEANFWVEGVKPISILPDTTGKINFNLNKDTGIRSGVPWGQMPYTNIEVSAWKDDERLSAVTGFAAYGKSTPNVYQLRSTGSLSIPSNLEGGYHEIDLKWRLVACNHIGTFDCEELKSNYRPLFSTKVYKEDNSCTPEIGEMIVTETFAAGTTFTKEDLRYSVKAFCHTLPILKIKEDVSYESKTKEYVYGSASSAEAKTKVDAVKEMKLEEFYADFGNVMITNVNAYHSGINVFVKISYLDHASMQSWEEYDLLNNGSYLTVPQGEIWTIFYTIDLDTSDVPVVCDPETDYDPELQKCVIRPGIVHVCSEGVFDPDEGVCVVQPSTKWVCDKGYYDLELKKCVYHVPQDQMQALCPIDSEWDDEREACVFQGETEWVCEVGELDFSVDPPVCKTLPETNVDWIQVKFFELFGFGVGFVEIFVVMLLISVGVFLLLRRFL